MSVKTHKNQRLFFYYCTLKDTSYLLICCVHWLVKLGASLVAQWVKNLPASAGAEWDVGLIPGSGRPPGEGNGNPLQYSCLENPMDREDASWWTYQILSDFSWMDIWVSSRFLLLWAMLLWTFLYSSVTDLQELSLVCVSLYVKVGLLSHGVVSIQF